MWIIRRIVNRLTANRRYDGSLRARIWLLLRVKFGGSKSRVEDPQQTPALLRQREQSLREVQKTVIDVATTRFRLEGELSARNDHLSQLDKRARQLLRIGNDDMMRILLQHKQTMAAECESLRIRLNELSEVENRLLLTAQKLAVHIKELESHQDATIMCYIAEKTQGDADDALHRISGQAGNRDGLPECYLQNRGSLIEREIQAIAIEDEIARLKTVLNREMKK